MSSACSRPPQILNGHHDDDDDDVECNDCHGDEDEEGKNDEKGYNHKINHRIFLSSQYCAIQLCWILEKKKALNVLAFPNFSILNGICMFFDDVI